eukprot:280342-Prymnesium_polylepis.1
MELCRRPCGALSQHCQHAQLSPCLARSDLNDATTAGPPAVAATSLVSYGSAVRLYSSNTSAVEGACAFWSAQAWTTPFHSPTRTA